jgi:2,3-bisphosphoglycerate-independent phosphoglycerate mutase
MFNLPFFGKRSFTKKPVVLVVLDGFGIAPDSSGNAITRAKTPNIDLYRQKYLNTSLIASGESVGLPANEEGNTEVGHLTLGAGRVILQDLKRISLEIEKGRFFDNQALVKAASHVKTNNSKLHLMGLIGSGHVHSSVEHLKALIQFCKKESLSNCYLHLFTDGRDSPPKEGIEIVKDLMVYMNNLKIGRIASITGRYWAMDRDRRWDRTERAYNAIVNGQGVFVKDPVSALDFAYRSGKTDEFVEPSVIVNEAGLPISTIDNNDAAVFFNFRIDRPKQLTMALVMPDFETLKTFDFGYDPGISREVGKVETGKTFVRAKKVENLFFVTMTEYQKELPVSGIVFAPETINNSLPQVLTQNGKKHLHMAESEKERFVKYYFNGFKEDQYEGETDVIIPSPKVPTYDKKPEMSLPKLVGRFCGMISKDEYDFAVINFANADMVAHSGNFKASVTAVEYIDRYIKRLIDQVLKQNGVLFVTADHGNAEELITYPNTSFFITSNDGIVNTDHSNNPVPLFVIGAGYEKKSGNVLQSGSLSDVAPTILGTMGLAVPKEMSGKNLLAQVNI